MIGLLNKVKYKNIISEELIFVLWFWEFALLRYFVIEHKEKSTLLLFLGVLVLLILSLSKGFKISKSFIVIIYIYVYVFYKYIFINNTLYLELFKDFFYKFIISGILPIYFLSQIKDVRKVLKLLIFVSVLVFIIFYRDPFNGYTLTGNYMGFGFLIALPVYFCLNIGRTFLGYKYLFPLEIITIVLIFCFSNRSAILSFIIFNLLKLILIKKDFIKKKFFKMIFFCLAGVIIIFLLKNIVGFAMLKMKQYDLNIRSISTVYNYLYGNIELNKLSSGRIFIWENAIEIFKQNIFFGSGFKIFELNYGYYCHNLILDLLTQFGIFGFLVFLYLCIKSFINILNYDYYGKILGIMFFSLWFPKLLFSSSMYYDSGLWMFLAFGLSGLKKYKFKFLK